MSDSVGVRTRTILTKRELNESLINITPPKHQALRRTEDVDIREAAAGGYYVGWTAASEYLRYMVEVTEDGEMKSVLGYLYGRYS